MGIFDSILGLAGNSETYEPGTYMYPNTPLPEPPPEPKQSDGIDWTTMIAAAIEGAASGYQGRAPQTGGLISRRMELERREKEDEEQVKLRRSTIGLHALQQMKELSDLVGDDPQKAAKAAKLLKPMLDMGGDTNFDEKDIASMLAQKDTSNIDAMLQFYPEIMKAGGFDTNTRQLLKQGKISLSQLSKQAKEQLGERAFESLIKAKDAEYNKGGKPTKVSDATFAELTSDFPDVRYLSDEHKMTLNQAGYKNIKSKSVLEAEAKGQIETAASRAATERAEMTEEGRQRRFEESQARMAAQFQQGQAATERRFQENLAALERQRERLNPAQIKQIAGNQQALAIIDDYEKAHDGLMKVTGGKLSATLKGSLAKNQKANTVAQLTGITGEKPEEQTFAAEYNGVIASLKTLTDEVGVLTDEDALRILKSFDPAVPPNQFKANLEARRKVHKRSIEFTTKILGQQGKNVGGIGAKSEGGNTQGGWSIRPK